MDKLILNEAKKNWQVIAQEKTPENLALEVEVYKALLNVFQVGDYYYLIFNPAQAIIEYCNEGVMQVLGYPPEAFTLEHLIENIHPDDLPYFLDYEATVTEFFNQMAPDKVKSYKTRYDYRIRTRDGNYKRLLQQVVTLQSDKEGAVLRTFVVHTDISHLKKNHKMTLSLIGLNGEPSYINVKSKCQFIPSKEIFTTREKEVLRLLHEGKQSVEIANELFIAKGTVDKHRKNILAKAGVGTSLELVVKALEKGWV